MWFSGTWTTQGPSSTQDFDSDTQVLLLAQDPDGCVFSLCVCRGKASPCHLAGCGQSWLQDPWLQGPPSPHVFPTKHILHFCEITEGRIRALRSTQESQLGSWCASCKWTQVCAPEPGDATMGYLYWAWGFSRPTGFKVGPGFSSSHPRLCQGRVLVPVEVRLWPGQGGGCQAKEAGRTKSRHQPEA